ncbi:hypothetical protein BCU66_004300 [Vibrio sp. 10N.286.49.B1]|uniref:hypothetical protein n=1 Tax=unclassified Vibrio TaxID=2614977 RepID=UPI000C82D620|nr:MULTISPECIES: hypothetical protein [unclassified Vibrio]PMH49823.1 hypothetical protein BCU66_19895 [Vibrio sp. 10N.286.49.B1]PMH83647.1 hypothetical protein BCU58_14000 [Vibrio sp. 10N.286.48.B7]
MRKWCLLGLLFLGPYCYGEAFPDFPDVVVCEVGQPYRNGAITLFAEYQDQNRVVFYRSMDGKQVMKIDRKGLVSAHNKTTKNSCIGRTLNALIAKGKVFDFQAREKK